jgi:hypothetical protein
MADILLSSPNMAPDPNWLSLLNQLIDRLFGTLPEHNVDIMPGHPSQDSMQPTIWIEGKASILADDKTRQTWFRETHYSQARKLLASLPSWRDYLNSLDQALSNFQTPFPDIGTFSSVRYLQVCVMECPEIENFTPKVVYRVADHTRSKLHKLREDVNETPSRKPKIHSNEQDPFSTPAGQFSESTIFDDDSPHFAQQSARTDVPESISPITKTTMKQYPSADDEEIVNAALVQFLSTVTMHFVPNAHWTHKRKAFQIGNKKDDNGFEAGPFLSYEKQPQNMNSE